ncbi:endonuclease/exonuclease/phosphatase family protein [Spirillospora sp. NBC_01491]|uniref:endonuclease/exonuclease/phosphatase family protein n=1 Tax=Spirillospora sp. NBC_01491 TaxID=2976007 RepID=UPI002E333EC2|nr:endonuclease/exonuclease/phosphatase family protein [Spirillospora sp. NBC_01491]
MTDAEPSTDDHGAGRGDRPRAWVTVLVWAVVALFAAWAALRTLGWEPGFRWRQLVAFTPYVAAAAVLVPVAALVMRRWWASVTAVAVACALSWAVLPRAMRDGDPPAQGPALRVLAANLRAGTVPADDLVNEVRRLRPDVLAVQELTPDAAAAFDAAGLKGLLPYRVLSPSPGVVGSGVYARFPVHEQQMIAYSFRQVRARVDVPGAPPVEVVSVHPCAPSVPRLEACWEAGLKALPPPGGKGPVRLLAGDFNATLDHRLMRGLIDRGYRDAADVTGAGLLATWPVNDVRREPTPHVTLDHVLADPRVAVRSFGTRTLPRTDHRAVRADLTLPRG